MHEELVNGVNVPELGKAIHSFRQDAALGRFQFRVRNKWMDGGHNQTTVDEFYGMGEERTSPNRPFTLDADEPSMLMGHDAGPNPVEYLLSALASCMTSSMVYHAAAEGIRIEGVESELEGELDIRGFLGISDEVRKGYQKIRVTFRVQSDAPAEELARFCKYSPVLDVVTHGTEVDLRVETVSAAEFEAAEYTATSDEEPRPSV